ncbi:hypothetical protein CLF_113274, partial [Clonorchis sinensis]
IRSPKRGTKGQEDEMGATFTDDRSPHGSLLGETTSLSLDGDRKLAHSAQMYHYQHQKQQMLAVERDKRFLLAQDWREFSITDVRTMVGNFQIGFAPAVNHRIDHTLVSLFKYERDSSGFLHFLDTQRSK